MKKLIISFAATTFLATAAQAATYGVVINEGVQEVSNPNGAGSAYAYDAAGERGGNGYTEVTDNAPRAAAGTPGANGSLEIHGDRSRYVIGNIYENGINPPGVPGASAGLVRLSQIDQLTFDWQTAVATPSQLHAAPVVRLHIMDSGIRSEMIWEHVYNGGSAGVPAPTGWQASGTDSRFYLNVRDNDGAAFLAQNPGLGLSIEGASSGQGVVYQNGGQLNQALGDWQDYFGDDAFVTGISFGAGSGFGAGFVGYIDNVGVTIGADTYVANFEVAQAVPEPASWAMMIGGFGLVGGAMRRRRADALAIA